LQRIHLLLQLHILSASVHDNDVVCTDGPAHQIMTALGWLVDAQMPILDGLQTRFFAASQGEAAVGCFAPMVVSLQFVKDCGTARTDSISQEEANQCDHNGGWQERVHSFPIQELCFSREPSMLEHMTSNTVSALQAAGHENVISTFVCDWHSRNAQQRILDHNLWLVCCSIATHTSTYARSDYIRRSVQSSSTTTQILLY